MLRIRWWLRDQEKVCLVERVEVRREGAVEGFRTFDGKMQGVVQIEPQDHDFRIIIEEVKT